MSATSILRSQPLAFGVDPCRAERYSLRQSRYDALGSEVGAFAQQFSRTQRKLRLLDVGVDTGVSRRHIETRPGTECIEYHGVDIRLREGIYRQADWHLYCDDLMCGIPSVPSESFDVVICEQVLEHLPQTRIAMAALARVLKPGGLLIVGVPIFPDGLHLVRRWGVPLADRILGRKKVRGHVQAWSRRTFTREFLTHAKVDLVDVRGFRVVSGGLLRRLENYRWWWAANRSLGALLPGICTEIQLVCRKPVKLTAEAASIRRAA